MDKERKRKKATLRNSTTSCHLFLVRTVDDTVVRNGSGACLGLDFFIKCYGKFETPRIRPWSNYVNGVTSE